MGMPNIPTITPSININRTQVINLILASIALEELSLAHLVNAEAEKLQFVLGQNPSLNQLLTINDSVRKTLRTVVKKEMLLEFKLEEVQNFLNPNDDDNDC